MKSQMQDSNFNEYLNPNGFNQVNWGICLDNSFSCLRQSWASQWVGLPSVLQRCVSFLNLSSESLPTEASHMLLVAQAVAHEIEFECTQSTAKPEPKYHNRLHTADVLTAMSVLIGIESKIQNKLDEEWVACALLSAIAHDFGHSGNVNYAKSEIESETMQKLRPFLSSHKVSSAWCHDLECAILNSDFSLVQKNHESVRGKEFRYDQSWLSVYLNEADVMASASSKFGPQLGHALAQEWQLIGFPAHQTVATSQGRKAFLKQLIFSSNASSLLRINESIFEELNQ